MIAAALSPAACPLSHAALSAAQGWLAAMQQRELGLALGALPLCKLLFVWEFIFLSQTPKPGLSFIPHHHWPVLRSCLTPEPHLISVPLPFMWLLPPNLTCTQPSHLLHPSPAFMAQNVISKCPLSLSSLPYIFGKEGLRGFPAISTCSTPLGWSPPQNAAGCCWVHLFHQSNLQRCTDLGRKRSTGDA